jgi:predicted permease
MSWLLRLRNAFRPELDRELEDELSHHLAMRAGERQGSGMDASAASLEARRLLGNPLQTRERMRDMDVSEWIDSALKDLRYAARQMMRSPGFTIVAVLSLALGIGANTGIFTMLNAVMMKTLPVRDPGALVILSDPDSAGVAVGSSGGERNLLTYPEFEQLRNRLDVFDGMFASESNLARYEGRINGGAREDVRARLITGGYFNVLGVSPLLGRFFTTQDDRAPAQSPYAVLSYDFWQRRFARSPSVLGTNIRLGNATLTVIGVAGPGFSGENVGQNPDLWAPMMMQPLMKPGADWLHEDMSKDLDKVMWLHAFGRLKPGMTIAQAQAETDVAFKAVIESGYGAAVLTEQARKDFLDQHLKLKAASKGASVVRNKITEPLFILLAVVGLVLLIACANVANLMMARAAARSREMGIRVALGAGRRRLVRQMLTESALLSLMGSAAGLLVAQGAIRLLLALSSTPGARVDLTTTFDLPVLAFTAAIAVLTALLFGVVPAIRATKVDLNSTLKEGSLSTTAPGGRLSFARLLVAIQVGLSLILLVGSGLFLRTLRNLQSLELGYAKNQIYQSRVDAQAAGYAEKTLVNLYGELEQRLRLIPGVRGVTYSENGLFNGTESGDRVLVEGFTPKRKDDEGSRFDVVGPGYFSTIGVPILLGREIAPEDVAGARHVVVINDAFAKTFFEGRSPIGRHITAQFGDNKWTWEVIGVSANVRDQQLRGNIPPRYYRTAGGGGYVPTAVSFQVRTAGPPGGVATAVRRVIQEQDDNLPIVNARTVSESVDRRVTGERTIAELSAIFGVIALALASIGLYGVLSFGVARRTGEIGIRMALGAPRLTVIGMILRETGWMVAAGILGGVLVAAGATRLIASQLFGVTPLDPATILAAVVVLMVVAVMAGLVPAHRASRVNPVTALRNE